MRPGGQTQVAHLGGLKSDEEVTTRTRSNSVVYMHQVGYDGTSTIAKRSKRMVYKRALFETLFFRCKPQLPQSKFYSIQLVFQNMLVAICQKMTNYNARSEDLVYACQV